MCQFFSGIVTFKNRDLIWDLDNDSHEFLLQKGGLKDTTDKPNFVRVELLPQDNDIFNHSPQNWKIHVDQDLIPDWFDKDEAEKLMKVSIKKVFDERFAIGKVEQIDKGRWFIGKNAQVEYIYGSAQVKYISGSAQVEYIYGSAQVKYISGSAQVENISGSAQVEYIYGSAQVKYISGSAQVKYISGSAQVKYISGSAQVGSIFGSAQVGSISGSAQVEYICGSAQVEYICGSAQVEYICGSAQVEYICGRSICCFTGKDAKWKEIKENGMAILYYKDNPEIIVANPKIKIKRFKQ